MKCQSSHPDAPRRPAARRVQAPADPARRRRRYASLGALLVLSLTRATAAIFDYAAPLTGATVTPGSGVVTVQVFDPEILAVVSTNVASGTTFDATTRDGVVAWSSGNIIRYFVYDPTRRHWIGDTANIGAGMTTSDLRMTNGIVTWSSGTLAYCRVYDAGRGVWKADSHNGGTPQNLRTVDGIVAWSTPVSVHARAYNPARGVWSAHNVAGATSELRNTNGVVAWSSGTTVNYAVHDPARGGWRGGSFNAGSTFDLRNANGVVAWSVGHVVYCRVYDPARNQWISANVDFSSGQTFNLNITANAVTWTGNGQNYTRGYNPATGGWYSGPGLPLSSFAVSTNSGNAPLRVSFIDMSIGGTAWTWDFGDGIGSSSRRSLPYHYATFGRFNAALSVAGVGNSSTNLPIITDTLPPAGTVFINTNAATAFTNLVSLALAATDNSGAVSAMRFSNDNASNWSNWVAYSTSHPWRLSAGDGTKTVFAQFRDGASNVSAIVSDTIVLDSIAPPVVSFVNASVDEGAGMATIGVVLDHPFTRAATVTYATGDGTATAGFDYTFSTGQISFAPQETNKSFTVPVLPDLLVELHETVTLTLSAANNCVAGPPGTLTILDDDLATVSFASTNFDVSEGAGTATVAVRLNAMSGRSVTVRYLATNGTAVAASDFTATSGVLAFAPGQTNLTFTVPIFDDVIDELSETVTLQLTNATNAILGLPASATLTILDNDAPTINFSASLYPVGESDGFILIDVILSKPFSQEVRANYSAITGTATAGVAGDYLPAVGLLIFSANVTNQTFLIILNGDAQPEPDETIHLLLSNITGALPGSRITADVMILDDDGPPRLTEPRLTAAKEFQTTLRGPVGQRFSIQTSLTLSNWTTLTTLTNTHGALEWLDPLPVTNGARRFYRTVLP